MTKVSYKKKSLNPGQALGRVSRAKPNKRVYKFITDLQRQQFLDCMLQPRTTIKQAALNCNIPYENAKLINRVYNNEGRAHRLKSIGRKPRRRSRRAGFGSLPSSNLINLNAAGQPHQALNHHGFQV